VSPDFLGYEDAIQMAQKYPEVVKDALRMKKVGNDIMALLGGREIHPINLRVGGFYKVPRKRDLLALLDDVNGDRKPRLQRPNLWPVSLFRNSSRITNMLACAIQTNTSLLKGAWSPAREWIFPSANTTITWWKARSRTQPPSTPM